MEHCLKTASQFLWGPGTLALLLGTGLFLTVRMDFLPWRNLGYALRSALGREARRTGRDGVPPFSALMTALAATIGTGNIVGVATALTAGGPGALLWMEVSAFAGLATKYTECMLAVKYRRRDSRGIWHGGPMYVMRSVLGKPGTLLGAFFALSAVGASFGIGGMTQANSIAGALETVFGVPLWISGPAAALLALAVMLGGVWSISKVCTALIPAMGIFYLAAGLAVIFGNLENLPAALAEIFTGALSPRAAAGGIAGAGVREAVRWGVARGVFSNEAGLGSAAISAASASTGSPVQQGYISMTGNVIDTMIICTVTGLAVCCSGVLGAADAAGQPVNGGALTILAFRTALGPLGAAFVAVSIVLFAFSTILGWEYQGETAFVYLFGEKTLPLYRLLFCLTVAWGAAERLEVVFRLSDVCNALMCIPNLFCLLLLSGEAARETRDFQKIRRKV
ncbi:MAG: alanine:cation symporter family protein [Oscillibacter sp.]|nr:alanine:cation symporter family protein [Oscillibacter sp.]